MANRALRRRVRRTLLLLALCLLAGILFFRDQQNRIQVEKFTVASPRLPPAFDGFTIVQISDLHGKVFGADNAPLLEKVAARRPDLIAITGDLIDSPVQLEGLSDLARALSAIAPTYYVTGNHEWASRQAKEVKLRLAENGVTPLSNEYLVLERDGQSLVLAGIDDPNGPYDQKTPEALAGEIRAALGDPYILLLAHRNEKHPVYAAARFDLVLCGHAHGGMIRLPFVGGLLGHDRLLPGYDAGLYDLGTGQMLVSRGLGNNTRPAPTFRLFNRPHLPVITLRTAQSAT